MAQCFGCGFSLPDCLCHLRSHSVLKGLTDKYTAPREKTAVTKEDREGVAAHAQMVRLMGHEELAGSLDRLLDEHEAASALIVSLRLERDKALVRSGDLILLGKGVVK